MSLKRTTSLLALWGQKLQGYIPPYAPACLVKGNVLMRYPVSGSVNTGECTARPLPSSLDQLTSHVSTSEWRASTAPVEVVWNANDAQPFHSLTPASPEDVRCCTEYLVHIGAEMNSNRSILVPVAPLSKSSESGEKPRTLRSSKVEDAVCVTLQALMEVVKVHSNLLAGAESLQTGVPLKYLLDAMEEAMLYLHWSAQTHHTRSITEDQNNADCLCGSSVDDPVSEKSGVSSDNFSAKELKEKSVLDSAQSRVTGNKESANDSPARLPAMTEEKCRALRVRFEEEVTYLHHQLREYCQVNGRHSRADNCATSPGASASSGPTASPSFTTESVYEYEVPLLTVVTSTHNSLVSALKAAAVAWAVEEREASTRVKVKEILWRPAPETGLSAAWLMALLRKQSHVLYSDDHGTLKESDVESAKHDSSTGALRDANAIDSRDKYGKIHEKMSEGAAETHPVPTAAPSPLLFNVLVTGAHTPDHFLRPWVSGVIDSGKVKCGVLLCCGCPSLQVRHIRENLEKQHTSQSFDSHVASFTVVELRTEVQATGLVVANREALTCNSSMHFDAAARTQKEESFRAECKAQKSKVFLEPVEPSKLSIEAVSTSTPHNQECSTTRSTVIPLQGKMPPSEAAHYTALFPLIAKNNQTASSSSSQRCPSEVTPTDTCLAEVASELFRRSVLEPPFYHFSRATTSSSSARLVIQSCGEDAAAPVNDDVCRRMRSASLPPSASTFSPATTPGWCSLCFVPQHHTSALLRQLAQRHWREPWYIGHSLDVAARRGPAPTSAHTQLVQDVLRCATQGVEVRGKAVRTTSSSQRNGKLAEMKRESEGWCSQRIRWRHGCGGFSLPLTATTGRSSPYTLPCLLFTDLEAVMSDDERNILSRFQASWSDRNAEKQNSHEAELTPESCREHLPMATPQTLSTTVAKTSKVATKRHAKTDLSCVDDTERFVAEAVTRAVNVIQLSVASLMEEYDNAERGYRGVVAGNFLFVCRFPHATECMVHEALTKTTPRALC